MARILIVDDQEMMRDSLGGPRWRGEGHEVVAAGGRGGGDAQPPAPGGSIC